MTTRFITKGKGQSRKVIPLNDKVAKPKLSAKTRSLMKSPLADTFDIDVVKAVTDEVGAVKSVDDEGKFWTVTTEDGKEYMLFEDKDLAKDFAVERVADDLSDQPELFTRDWLMSHVNEDGLRDSLRADEENMNRDYVNEIEDEEDAEYGTRLKAELIERGIISEDADVTDEVKEDMVGQMTDERLEDPMAYLDELGYEGERLMDILTPHIDLDEASEDAVDTDGMAHFLATYDGEQVDTATEHVLFRQN